MMCPKTRPLLLNNAGSQFKFNLVNSDVSDRAFTYDSGPTGIVIVADPEVARYAVESSTTIEKVAVNSNAIVDPIDHLELESLNTQSPNLSPKAQSAAGSGADFSDPEYASYFTSVNFRGAVGAQNWTRGNWTSWK